jgi:hypothetical protein
MLVKDGGYSQYLTSFWGRNYRYILNYMGEIMLYFEECYRVFGTI